MSFIPPAVQRQQTFTSSGTFTPSARLLQLGGWVEAFIVGGGGGGGGASGNSGNAGGGGGGQIKRFIVQITGAVTVTVGAGGAAGTAGGAGAGGDGGSGGTT